MLYMMRNLGEIVLSNEIRKGLNTLLFGIDSQPLLLFIVYYPNVINNLSQSPRSAFFDQMENLTTTQTDYNQQMSRNTPISRMVNARKVPPPK